MSDDERDVQEYLAGVTPAKRARDAHALFALMRRATGEEPRMWGSIVGFGQYHYRYESGREGDAPAAGCAARKGATTVYLADGIGAHAAALERLGPHATGVGCLYVKDLEAVDLGVLEAIVERAYATLTAGTYTLRAREGGRACSGPSPRGPGSGGSLPTGGRVFA